MTFSSSLIRRAKPRPRGRGAGAISHQRLVQPPQESPVRSIGLQHLMEVSPARLEQQRQLDDPPALAPGSPYCRHGVEITRRIKVLQGFFGSAVAGPSCYVVLYNP